MQMYGGCPVSIIECLPSLGKVNPHVGAAQDSVPMVRCVKRKAVPLHVIASSTAMLTLCEALRKNQIREILIQGSIFMVSFNKP
jgi:hypothetical protein